MWSEELQMRRHLGTSSRLHPQTLERKPAPRSARRSVAGPLAPAASGISASWKIAERRFPRCFELIARAPSGGLVGIRDEPHGKEAEARVVDHAVEVPIGSELIARLVVVMGLEVEDPLGAPSLRSA